MDEAGEMDVDQPSTSNKKAKISNKAVALKAGRLPKSDRNMAGLRDETVSCSLFEKNGSDHFLSQQLKKAQQLHNFAKREPNRLAKASESDRAVTASKPRHLVSPKLRLVRPRSLLMLPGTVHWEERQGVVVT